MGSALKKKSETLRAPVKPVAAPAKKLLHVGCGPKLICPPIPKLFRMPDWQEIRLDIDAKVEPDVVASITGMPEVATGSVDAVFSSHNIEHLMFHEVDLALREFHRVLAPGGFVLLTCPDIQSAAELIAKGQLFNPAYQSSAGPISAFDMVFGYSRYTRENPYMAHKSGFTLNALMEMFSLAGFEMPLGFRNTRKFDMWVLAYKNKTDEAGAKQYFDALLKF